VGGPGGGPTAWPAASWAAGMGTPNTVPRTRAVTPLLPASPQPHCLLVACQCQNGEKDVASMYEYTSTVVQ